MATYEKVGDQYRAFVGMNDHHPMYRMMPEGFEPGPEDEVIDSAQATGAVADPSSEEQAATIDEQGPVDVTAGQTGPVTSDTLQGDVEGRN